MKLPPLLGRHVDLDPALVVGGELHRILHVLVVGELGEGGVVLSGACREEAKHLPLSFSA